MILSNFYQKIINIGTKDLEIDSNLYIRVTAMNKIMLMGLLLTLIVISVGFYIQDYGFVITGGLFVLLVFVSFLLTYFNKYRLTWHFAFLLPSLLLVFMPFFFMTSPSVVIFFTSFLALMLFFFRKKRVLRFYFIYYSVCSIVFLFFLFEVNAHHINNNIWMNMYSLFTGLAIVYYSLQFYIFGKIKNEKNLHLEEEKFRTLFEKSPLGVMISEVNSDGIKTVNKALSNMLGYTTSELEAKQVSFILYPDETDFYNQQFQQLLNGEIDFFELEKKYLHKNGIPIWAKVVVTNVKDRDNQPLYTLAILLNITEQKRQQQKISELFEKLQTVNTILEEKVTERTEALTLINEELKRSNQDLEQFAYAASHDLKEPLRMIGSFVQVLERQYSDKIDDRGKEYIQFTVEGVQRMSALISSLLQYSRVGRKEAKIRLAKISNMIEIKLIDLSQLIEDKKATINIKNLPSMLKCEPMQLGLVFYNLINNGLKFNESPNPTITIDAKEEKDQVIFSVADNGIGIEQKFKDSVFEIFKRLHGGDKYEGTGIGLALCRKIIYRHNGNIWLESEIGKGTTFYFSVSKNL